MFFLIKELDMIALCFEKKTKPKTKEQTNKLFFIQIQRSMQDHQTYWLGMPNNWYIQSHLNHL